jgi:hypothetical protein
MAGLDPAIHNGWAWMSRGDGLPYPDQRFALSGH